jgi:hypothetical protein
MADTVPMKRSSRDRTSIASSKDNSDTAGLVTEAKIHLWKSLNLLSDCLSFKSHVKSFVARKFFASQTRTAGSD